MDSSKEKVNACQIVHLQAHAPLTPELQRAVLNGHITSAQACQAADALEAQALQAALQAAQPKARAAPASVGSVGRRKPYQPTRAYRPFPVEALPELAGQYVKTASAAIGCDPAFVAVPLLAVLAGCIGNSRAVLLKRGWVEPCVVWGLTVGESGTVKSPAYYAAVDPLIDIQMSLEDAHRGQVEAYQHDKEAWSARSKDQRGEKPRPPAEPLTYVTSDATIAAL